MTQTDGYHIRPYRAGDEEVLATLFNRAHRNLIGFVPRTAEYWKWCVLSRPGVSRQGVGVAVKAGQVVGYAAMEKSGNILEFCYDPDCRERILVLRLLEWCIDSGIDQGASSITLNAPTGDTLVREACEEKGLVEELFPSLFLRVLDICHILRGIADQKESRTGLPNEKVQINLEKYPSWCSKNIAVLVENGEISVSTESLKDSTVKIATDISTVSSVIFGSRKTIYKAVLQGKLRIAPWWKIPVAVGILSFLQLEDRSWFVPRGDYG